MPNSKCSANSNYSRFILLSIFILLDLSKYLNCASGDSIEISVIGILPPVRNNQYESSKRNWDFSWCDLHQPGQNLKNITAPVTNLTILNKSLEIGPEITEKLQIVLICNAKCPIFWRFQPVKVNTQ